nr:hypothetical protein B0A51_05522 [Rachicladosporium sp. CCFEE 5018]
MALEASQATDERYVFTTLRYDPALRQDNANTAASAGYQSPIYLVSQHCDRLQEAAEALWSAGDHQSQTSHALSPDQLVETCTQHLAALLDTHDQSAVFRMSLALHSDGRLIIRSASSVQSPGSCLFPATLDTTLPTQWTAILDSQATASSIACSFKTSDRTAYDTARERAGVGSVIARPGITAAVQKEVLLFGPTGDIMDASITTPYFFQSGRWVTPPASSGGQQGTTRRWALSQHLCVEEAMSKDSLRDGEVIWLSNAFRGFFAANVQLG